MSKRRILTGEDLARADPETLSAIAHHRQVSALGASCGCGPVYGTGEIGKVCPDCSQTFEPYTEPPPPPKLSLKRDGRGRRKWRWSA